MRTIKFRAKMCEPHPGHNGSWVYIDGVGHNQWYSANGRYYGDIQPKTIGQFMGFLDKSDQEIYEGDITFLDYGRGKQIAAVEWHKQSASFVFHTASDGMLHPCAEVTARLDAVIGNIYDNPELLRLR